MLTWQLRLTHLFCSVATDTAVRQEFKVGMQLLLLLTVTLHASQRVAAADAQHLAA
jgi:hypothetical protein